MSTILDIVNEMKSQKDAYITSNNIKSDVEILRSKR